MHYSFVLTSKNIEIKSLIKQQCDKAYDYAFNLSLYDI